MNTTIKEVLNELTTNRKSDIQMSNGDILTITPCGYGNLQELIKQGKYEEIDFWLIDGSMPWLSANNYKELEDIINGYDELIEKNEQEKIELRKYYESNDISDPYVWEYYSDWYKDVYGHRPRG